MLLPGVLLGLAAQDLQVSADALASAGWLNDVIHETWKWGRFGEKCHWRGGCVRQKGAGLVWCGGSPLTAAGKGLANFSTYSASASAWLSFPLKMICTAPWKQGEERVIRSCC